MILKELLASTPVYEIIGLRKLDITGLALVPEDAEPGFLYIHHPDMTELPYEEAVRHAVQNGASAVCIDQDQQPLPGSVTYIKTYHLNRFLSACARNFFHNPSQSMNLTGITGSHGKTTIGFMVQSVLRAAGQESVVMGMSQVQMGSNPAKPYTRGFHSLAVQQKLREALQAGIQRGIIECSYTGIVEEVLRHIRFNSLIYTDLYTHFQNQRADYHYFEIRKHLIDYLQGVNSPIIVNMDDYYAHEMNHPTVWRYGLFGDFDVCSTRVMLSPRGADFTLTTPKGPVDIRLKAAGIHNVYNAMAACTWGISEGIALDDIQHGLEAFEETQCDQLSAGKCGSCCILRTEGGTLEGVQAILADLKRNGAQAITAVLCAGTHLDHAYYKALGCMIAGTCSRLIITSDYRHPHSSVDTALVIAQGILNAAITHEADNFKALQKAAAAGGPDESIVIIR